MLGQKILVTAIGSFSADIVIRSLQYQGYKVIGSNIYPKEWIANGNIVDGFYQVPPALNECAFIEEILDICKKEKVEYILPLTDIEIDVFNENREIFENENIILCISSYETINVCRNKKKCSKMLKKLEEVNVIPEYSVEEIEDGNIKYPIICKKVNGRSSEGLKRINNKEEFRLFLKKNDINSYLIQPFIEGDVVAVDVVRNIKTGKCVAVPRKELLRTLNGAGTTVHVFINDELEKVCINIADKLNINGCVNFEFIESDNKWYFLECNPRFSGGVKFTCMSGYNCVLNHLRCFQGKEIEDKRSIIQQYIARKYEEYVTKIK